ncbi:MnhB domain-containing protein [Saccharopolyspora flava]|uniref:Multisubunit sodium/proton antiporter, MrpB subunit (TC 2.A.63.1) n=1 Tax=Saccharopolyspora flava TaxID=95161 RepID=A0A1I6PLU1_9PSEU|nr:MnhB domain-containing protein [Saccharopolyspora flava]SFS41161.1 multisubunit sodium/proton antiporter, MrpB subunit (TC 2.A.63.1) [Saccharopolyspora flava]
MSPTTPRSWTNWDAPTERWLLSGFRREGQARSVLLELAARIVFPTVLVLSIYLLFAGHDRAGGGFTGGLVAGQAFLLRYLAGGRMDDSAVVSMRPPVLIGLGLTLACAAAFLPLLFGGQLLETAIYKFTVPLLGEIKFVSSVILDTGVFLLIVGVVLDLLRTLGSGIETDADAAARGRR